MVAALSERIALADRSAAYAASLGCQKRRSSRFLLGSAVQSLLLVFPHPLSIMVGTLALALLMMLKVEQAIEKVFDSSWCHYQRFCRAVLPAAHENETKIPLCLVVTVGDIC